MRYIVSVMAGMFYRTVLMRSAQNRPLPVASPRKSPLHKSSRSRPQRTISPLKQPIKSKDVGKSQSDSSLVSTFRNLSISSNPQPPSRSKSTSPRKGKSSQTRGIKSYVANSVEDIANLIKGEKCKNVIVMAGAGISTPSGIPDFRSPGTGLYDNLQQYKIPEPAAIFDLDYFWYDPRPFFCLAKSLYPGNYQPNYVHYFVKLLNHKGLLLRMYTQNIDGLERLADIPASKLIEAHGSFLTASCIRCHQSYDGEQIKATIMNGDIPRCSGPRCSGVIKPDIVFFGEDLPKRFYSYVVDFPKCDLLLIMGTSLEVEPFAGIANAVGRSTPRLLLNKQVVGPFSRHWQRRTNDVVQRGDVVEGVRKLVDLLGWSDSMDEIVNSAKEQWAEVKIQTKKTDHDDTKATKDLAKSTKNSKEGITSQKTSLIENNLYMIGHTGNGANKDTKASNTRNLHSLANGYIGKRHAVSKTDKSNLFSQRERPVRTNSTFHRVPLLPFRYTHRKDLNTAEDKSKDFKTIDPGKDLASAGFGLGKRTLGLGCFLAGTSNDISSSDSEND